mmetsp:Transcript_29443/g.70118  ORF Transcript_29443/g.70118 Transcript_29443/m.70118 type:complete len:241 (+) Transcript_29443:131-853(+)
MFHLKVPNTCLWSRWFPTARFKVVHCSTRALASTTMVKRSRSGTPFYRDVHIRRHTELERPMSPKRLKYFGPTRVSAMEAAKLIDITSWINSLSLPSRIIFPPERLVLGTVQTVWDFPDIWIIPVIFFSIRPLLIVLSAVLRIMKHSEWRYWQGWGYYVKKYDESNLKQLEGPLKALCIPLLLNFLISQVLNTAFTYKMVKPGILKKITVLSHNVSCHCLTHPPNGFCGPSRKPRERCWG